MFVIVMHGADPSDSRAFGPFDTADQAIQAVPLAMAADPERDPAEVIRLEPLVPPRARKSAAPST